MTYVTLLTMTLLIMNVLMLIQVGLRKAENKQNAKLRKLVIDLCENCISYIEEENNSLDCFLVKMTANLQETREENSDFIEKAQSEYKETLVRHEREKMEAVRHFNLVSAAIRSLEPNYRKKIQFQIDKIVSKEKSKPAKKQEEKK